MKPILFMLAVGVVAVSFAQTAKANRWVSLWSWAELSVESEYDLPQHGRRVEGLSSWQVNLRLVPIRCKRPSVFEGAKLDVEVK